MGPVVIAAVGIFIVILIIFSILVYKNYNNQLVVYKALAYENSSAQGPLHATWRDNISADEVLSRCLADSNCMIAQSNGTRASAYAAPPNPANITFNPGNGKADVYIRRSLKGYNSPPTADWAPPGYQRLPRTASGPVMLDVTGMNLSPLYQAGPAPGTRYASTSEGYDACLADPNCAWMTNNLGTTTSSYYANVANPKFVYGDGNSVTNYKPSVVGTPNIVI